MWLYSYFLGAIPNIPCVNTSPTLIWWHLGPISRLRGALCKLHKFTHSSSSSMLSLVMGDHSGSRQIGPLVSILANWALYSQPLKRVPGTNFPRKIIQTIIAIIWYLYSSTLYMVLTESRRICKTFENVVLPQQCLDCTKGVTKPRRERKWENENAQKSPILVECKSDNEESKINAGQSAPGGMKINTRLLLARPDS